MKLLYLLVLSLFIGTAIPIRAQITTDGSTNTTLTSTDKGIQIDDGERADDNLFHSFSEFSVPTGSEAFFNNPSDIVNIFSRVTGGNISNIDGLIRANGGANLFLINPAGILFGNNATLNIGGSFYGSTADSIVFPNEIEFAASNPVKPILTVNAPIGLRFRDNSGDIVNQSVAGLAVKPGNNFALIGGNILLEGGAITEESGQGNIELGSVADNNLVGLKEDNSSFRLGYEEVTGFRDITLSQGAKITTSESDINLQGNRIALTDGSQITSQVTEEQVGGNININARELLIDKSNIATTTLGIRKAGNINVNVLDKTKIVGDSFEDFQDNFIIRSLNTKNPLNVDVILEEGNGILTVTNNQGATGNISIESNNLQLQEGALISGFTIKEGHISILDIKIDDSLEIVGSGIFSLPLVGSTGNSENIIINTKNLTISEGGVVSSATLGEGEGGDIFITASEQIDLVKGLPDSRVPTGIFSNSGLSNGEAGKITIDTSRLNLESGGQITSASGIVTRERIINSGGKGGDIEINADESIRISGGNSNNPFLNSAIATSTFTENDSANLNINSKTIFISNFGAISARTLSQGNGGDITINTTESFIIDSNSGVVIGTEGLGNGGQLVINTDDFSLINNGNILANSTNIGNIGKIIIEADNLTLDNGFIDATNDLSSPITNNESSVTEVNIDLNIKNNLILENSSFISAQALENASGGNINIDAQVLVAFPNQNNDILANAQEGKGGDINITAQGVLGIEERNFDSFDEARNNKTNDISASSEFGQSGSVTFNLPDNNSIRETNQLSLDVISDETVISDACSADEENNSLVLQGKGGIHPAPNLPLNSEILLGENKNIVPSSSQLSNQKISQNIISQIQPIETTQGNIYPARGVVKTEDGKVILTAYSLNNSIRPNSNLLGCK